MVESRFFLYGISHEKIIFLKFPCKHRSIVPCAIPHYKQNCLIRDISWNIEFLSFWGFINWYMVESKFEISRNVSFFINGRYFSKKWKVALSTARKTSQSYVAKFWIKSQKTCILGHLQHFFGAKIASLGVFICKYGRNSWNKSSNGRKVWIFLKPVLELFYGG